jgi:hypothetical protein
MVRVARLLPLPRIEVIRHEHCGLPPFLSRFSRTGAPVTPAGRWVALAGAAYIVGWVAALLVGPAAPEPTASAAEVAAYYLAQRGLIVVQALLAHGLAEIALAALALALVRATRRAGPAARWLAGSGPAAAAVSLAQGRLRDRGRAERRDHARRDQPAPARDDQPRRRPALSRQTPLDLAIGSARQRASWVAAGRPTSDVTQVRSDLRS